MWSIPFKNEVIVLVIVGLLFLVSGADAAISFLHNETSGEILGSIATVLAAALGFIVRKV